MLEDETEYLLNFTRFNILYLLYEKPRHGYAIMSEFKRRFGKNISPGLVYPFLQELEEHGYVEQQSVFEGKKEKKIFKLTPQGRVLAEHLIERMANILSTALTPKLDVCYCCGAKILEGGVKKVIDGKEYTFCCEHCANSCKSIPKESKNQS